MAYHCTRCELDELPHESRQTAMDDDLGTILFCFECQSNTGHVPTTETV